MIDIIQKMKRPLLFIILFSIGILLLNAQVTIGSTERPVLGGLLHLSMGAKTDGSNSTKGLLLPRVELINKSSLAPTVTDATNTEKLEHIGLLVYNLTEGVPQPASACDPTPNWSSALNKGLVVWSGDAWEQITSEDASIITPPDWVKPDLKFLKDHEGNFYPVAEFGDAGVWMLENLRTTSPEVPYMNKLSTIAPSQNHTVCNINCQKMFSEFNYSYVSPPDDYTQNTTGYDFPAYNNSDFF